MLDHFFQLSHHETTRWCEVQADLTTYAVLSFILAVNPALPAAPSI